MTEIISVRFDLPAAGVDMERYLGQATAPFEWEGGWPLPQQGFHLLSLVDVNVVGTSGNGSPQVRGIPLPHNEVDGYFFVRWVFPGATNGNEAAGDFRALFYRD